MAFLLAKAVSFMKKMYVCSWLKVALAYNTFSEYEILLSSCKKRLENTRACHKEKRAI